MGENWRYFTRSFLTFSPLYLSLCKSVEFFIGLSKGRPLMMNLTVKSEEVPVEREMNECE